MLNKVGVKIKLIRSRDAFCLMGAASKVRIIHASMFARKVKLIPSAFLAHAKTLEDGTAKYPIRRVVCKTFAVPQNYLDVTHEKLFFGQLPTRIVVGLVNNQAFNGDHFNLVRQGNVRLALKCTEALEKTISVVAYAEFENVIKVDRDRNVIFDFGYEYGGDRSHTASARERL